MEVLLKENYTLPGGRELKANTKASFHPQKAKALIQEGKAEEVKPEKGIFSKKKKGVESADFKGAK
jgi:hypothetical protein